MSLLAGAMLVLQLLSLLAPASAILPCVLTGIEAPAASDTVDPSCSSVVFDAASFSHQSAITFNISAMLLANPSSDMIRVTLHDCFVQDGSSLIFDSRNLFPTRGEQLPELPAVSISIKSLRGQNSAIVFAGLFPKRTSILISKANMSADNISTAARLPQLDEWDPMTAKLLLLFNFTLVGNSSFILVNASLTVAADTSGISLAVLAGMSVLNWSTFAVINSSLTSSAFAMWIYLSPLTIGFNSEWVVVSSALLASRYSSILISRSPVTVRFNSTWNLISVILTSTSSALRLVSSLVMIVSTSVWSIASSTLTVPASSIALHSYFSQVILDGESQWRIESCTMARPSGSPSQSLSGAAMWLEQSFVIIRKRSVWIVSNNVFVCKSIGNAENSYAIAATNSNVTLVDESAWLLSRNTISTSSRAVAPISFDINSPLEVGIGCLALWLANNMSTGGHALCVQLLATLTIRKGGVLSFVENNCTSTKQIMGNGSSAISVAGDGTFFEQCSRLNGIVLSGGGGGLPSSAVSAGMCGSCNSKAQCFQPMTIPGSPCRVSSLMGTAACSCTPQGDADNMCLPTTALILPTLSTPTLTRNQSWSRSLTPLTSIRTATASPEHSSSLSISESESCATLRSAFLNTSLSLSGQSRGSDDATVYPAGSAVLVRSITAASLIRVTIVPRLGVTVTDAAAATGNLGVDWEAGVVGASRNLVELVGVLTAKSTGELSLVTAWMIRISVEVKASGTCLKPNYQERLEYTWPVVPLPPQTSLEKATEVTFRSATGAANLLGNPLVAISATAAVSIVALESCTFSDVDPLSASISPIAVAVGPQQGQYYRGAAVVALGVYVGGFIAAHVSAATLNLCAGEHPEPHAAKLAILRFPSLGMLGISLLGEGLATCAVSLLRVRVSEMDIFLGATAISACVSIAAWALFATTGSRLLVRLEPVARSELDLLSPRLKRLLKPFVWSMHYVDISTNHFKRRHLLLLEGLEKPWWTAVELGSATFQGSVLGIRVNEQGVCSAQQWVLVVQTAFMLALAARVRPYGAPGANVFLVLSKLCGLVVSLMVLLESLLFDGAFSSIAEIVTFVATGIGSLELVISVIVLLVSLFPRLKHVLHKYHRGRQDKREGRSQVELEVVLIPSSPPRQDQPHCPPEASPAEQGLKVPLRSQERRVDEGTPPQCREEQLPTVRAGSTLASQPILAEAPPCSSAPTVQKGAALADEASVHRILACLVHAVDPETPPPHRLPLLLEAICRQQTLAVPSKRAHILQLPS
jgi:hypothetical protein